MINRHSRRDVFGLAAGAAATAAWAHPALAAPSDADLVVYNAKVYTVDERMPQAQAFAVKGGRFVAVGSTDAIKGLIGKDTKTLDAKGMTIVPGFIDCHNHAWGARVLYDVVVNNPYDVEFFTIDSVIEKLKAKAAKTPPGTWVAGYFYDDIKMKDGRLIDVRDLDKVSTVHPVVVNHRGGHTSFYNSKAFELAGITKETPARADGTFDKFPDGELNGRVTDRARQVFDKVGARETFSPDETFRRDREGQAFISQKFAEYGLTGVCHQGGNLRALQAVRAEGRQKHRISFETSGDTLDAMIKTGMKTGLGDEWIKLGATSEHTADGSLSERTMAMSIPYPGSNSPYKGNVTETQGDLNAWVEMVHRAGIQVNCHANGDVAIEAVLTAYERAQKLFPVKDPRFKITHCSLVDDGIVKRLKALGVTPALFNTYLYYNSDKFAFYGEDLMKRMMAYRTLLDAGIPACVGTDFGAGVFPPLMGIQGCVTRKGWDGKSWGLNQRISVAEALKVHTLNGAYNTQEEAIKGSITPGKLADYVILADDPHTIDPDKIKDIKIVATVVGGTTVHQA